MRYALVLALVLLNIWPNQAAAVERFELGGSKPWSTWTGQNTMVDDFTDPSVLQPRELKPNENLLPRSVPGTAGNSPQLPSSARVTPEYGAASTISAPALSLESSSMAIPTPSPRPKI